MCQNCARRCGTARRGKAAKLRTLNFAALPGEEMMDKGLNTIT